MRAGLAMLLFVLVVALVSPAQARGPYGSISAAGWSGGAYTDDKTGAFTSCIASASYKSGITFSVVVSKTYEWALAFIHPSWTLTPGQKFPIVLSFDGRNTFNVDGTVFSTNMVAVPMPVDSALVKSFRAAKTMSAFAQGNLFQFTLDGTAVMLPALVYCAKTVNQGGLAAATNFMAGVTRAAAVPHQPAPPPVTATANAKPSRPQGASAELQLEAMQIASNFILKAALSHPSILGGGEKPVWLMPGGVAWKADNATGFVRIVPPEPNVDGLEVAAIIVGNDARDCKGKFISARNSELVDSQVVFRGMSSCEDSEKSDITEYFIFPRKAGGFVLFSVITPTKALGQQAQGPQRDEANAAFRKAAYTSIAQ
ncbi:conserved exported hypothetical protein [Bradyrhizobium sp. STM 3843]|nr:conserved exported hypothetical protein [Bradyrhizobium sp. STM 3843]